MSKNNLLGYDINSPDYAPNRLLNLALQELALKSDYQLSAALSFSQSSLSRIRLKKIAIPPTLLILIMAATDWTLSEVLDFAGIELAVAA